MGGIAPLVSNFWFDFFKFTIVSDYFTTSGDVKKNYDDYLFEDTENK